ncbi:hypothetical protein CKO25_15815 [Thiocapsa imhoffii]|uniref:SWIM-type domain-containing protein n=1 Tax=Thiocapsa imhoffii TaxID=382777 RepID=A0A9X0WL41_9GAMM|nr:SWIM zinc finger family protein [Thiocapsa imhoffii]MBK1646087.1 hypothetical protein [Thiocapsa imhoffii]
MTRPGRTWWGEHFLAALASFTDRGRLERGRGYASDHRVRSFKVSPEGVTATIRGQVNPYFGVYQEPRYQTRIQMQPIRANAWDQMIAELGQRASIVAKLLMNEMPDEIDQLFARHGLALLPRSRQDFRVTECSCPDDANPCKHIAGLYYRLAAQLDQDPFLLFELRGLTRERLNTALRQTPLGSLLADVLEEEDLPLIPATTYYTQPVPTQTAPHDPTDFWTASRRLPSEIHPITASPVPGILIKKGGEMPPFWEQDTPFVTIMEELYERVRTKNKGIR